MLWLSPNNQLHNIGVYTVDNGRVGLHTDTDTNTNTLIMIPIFNDTDTDTFTNIFDSVQKKILIFTNKM